MDEKSNMLDAIIIIIRFVPFALDRGQFSDCILNPETSCICMSRRASFSAFSVVCILRRILVFSCDSNKSGKSIETMENHAAYLRAHSLGSSNTLFLWAVIFTVESTDTVHR